VTDLDFVDEQSLLAAAQAGDQEAFGRLVERHRKGLEAFCFLMLGDAHDGKCALSETVLCAWRERELVQPIVTARMWLYRNAMLVCLKDLDARR
jgi:DNA-directed RNA polymerase specialized sigma24 family protein